MSQKRSPPSTRSSSSPSDWPDWLDWEENVFVGLRGLYRRWFTRPRDRRLAAVRATLDDRRQELLLLAQMVAGRPLALFETVERRLASGDRVFLPAEFSAAGSREGNAALYDLKALAAALAVRESSGPSSPDQLAGWLHGFACEFPGLPDKLAKVARDLPEGTVLGSLFGVLAGNGDPAGESQDGAGPPHETNRPENPTEIEGQGQSDVEVLADPGDDGPGHDLPMHTFEKVETIEEYGGQSRKRDSDDELEEHAEALPEVDMRQVVRTSDPAGSIYRADIILDGLALEVADEDSPGVPYPEWDFRKRRYREDWCRVQAGPVEGTDPAWLASVTGRRRRLVDQLRREFAAIASASLRVKRQTAGAEIDIDAVVESETARRSGHAPSEAIYLDVRRDLEDVAALVLLDLSYSTDAWLDGVRVLDTIRESVFCVGEVLEEFIEKFAVAGFSSNTRRSCRFHSVKGFDEPWEQCRGRLGRLEPSGYTRMGAALRHAQTLLRRETARHKAILLVTDGRPCDYDRYEGNYGIHDVRKALESGRLDGITTHAIAIEKRASESFPRMFTRHHYDIIPHPDRLSQTVCKFFAKLKTG